MRKGLLHSSVFVSFLCFLSCTQNSKSDPAKFPVHQIAACPSPQKISVARDQVYDLGGYADEGMSDPYHLFDENAHVDPRYNRNLDTVVPVTDPLPHRFSEIYFPKGKGNRIVVDLQVVHHLSEIYVYDPGTTDDSILLYTGTMQDWKLRAAFTGKTDHVYGWRRFILDDSARYIMIRFNSIQAKITEAVLYGCPLGPLPTAVAETRIAPVKKIMNEFIGANYFSETPAKWLQPFYYHRLYTYTRDFDTDAEDSYPGTVFNMKRYRHINPQTGEPEYFFDSLGKNAGKQFWYSIQGVPMWMHEKKYTDKDRVVNKPGMDPEDPMSYTRHASMMWNLAAFFGLTRVDTGLMSISTPKRSGRGVMQIYENGNEEDATWVGDKYSSPYEQFIQASADYDGHEGKLGKQFGIHQADSNCMLMMSGLVELDTNKIRVFKFLCNTLRRDKKFIWQAGIQYHHYAQHDIQYAITPEEDSLRDKLQKVALATRRMVPGVPVLLGENGYDKYQGSRQATPLVKGFDIAQSQGILLLRSINAAAFSGIDAYILYWLKDYLPPDDHGVYLTSGIIREMPDGKIIPYPGWFYISTFVNQLGKYYADTVISEKGNVWIYKYRNTQVKDSVAYFVYCPTRNGAHAEHFSLHTGKVKENRAAVISFGDYSASGIRTNVQVQDGRIEIAVEEKPKLILLKEE